MKKTNILLTSTFGGIVGACTLVGISAFQKFQLGYPISPKSCIIPATVGFISFFLIVRGNLNLRKHNLELEEKVKSRTKKLDQLNYNLSITNKRYTEIFENMSSGVAIFQTQDMGDHFTITDFNHAAEKIENISRDEVKGKEIREAFPGVVEFGLLEVLRRVYHTGKAESLSAGKYHDSRLQGWRENYIYKLPTEEVVAIYDDVTERKKMEENLELLANTDSLTGISNRRHFFSMLERELKRAKRYNLPSTFLMLDLDHFKKVNDNYGHDIGDMVLKKMSSMCQKLLREVDEFGRLGGEEFGIFLPDTSLQGAMQVAERIRKSIQQIEIPVGNQMIPITASIGVAVTLNGELDSKELMRLADDALYQAKQEGRNRVIESTECCAAR